MSRRAPVGISKSVLILTLVAIAACGGQPPTAPPDPETPDVNWAALARLFDDPLFKELPRLLRSQDAARPLNTAVSKLVAGIKERNLNGVKGALSELADARGAYSRSPSYQPGDAVLLVTLSLFEMRGRGEIPGWSPPGAEDSSLALENRP